MGEYRCEGIGSVNGGTYDKLLVEGVFTAKGPITANYVSGEGVMNYSGLSADDLDLEGVTNVKGALEAVNCNMEGVLNADKITVYGKLYADGAVQTALLKATCATLLYNRNRAAACPFSKIRAFFTGRDSEAEKNARIGEIEADKLVIQDYSVAQITGQDIAIGRNCIVDKVQADTRLRIHKSAVVKDFGTSVAAEYFE